MITAGYHVLRVFGWLLAPFGHGLFAFDLILWPVLAGFGALFAYKLVSNQKAIRASKRHISVHLIEIRLFQHDLVQVLSATGRVLWHNGRYLGHNLLPLLVLFAPMMVVAIGLVANYAYAPAPVGTSATLTVTLDPSAQTAGLLLLDAPLGVVVETPMVAAQDGRLFWRLRATAAGDHVITVRIGDDVREEFVWAVGGAPRLAAPKRAKSWEALLYPAMPPLAPGSPVAAMVLALPTRALVLVPDGEQGLLLWFFVLSLATGLVGRRWVGVTF